MTSRKSILSRLWGPAALLALTGCLASLPASRAHADGTAAPCGSEGKPCIVLVSVDGLEPKDPARYLVRDAQGVIESIEALVRIHSAQEEDIYDHAAAR